MPPERVIAFDDPDPYLVVAADKGTARFSDVANAVSAEYDYWMGDAFASGGSHGYDHKEVGITAKGAWECVKRHFREKGKDIQQEPFTVVGIGDMIGDMSGDVFGNGMLLSRQICLLAAFDHRHVFVDPDPERSFQECERIFRLGRSSWGDYDTSLLSEGGMVVPRGYKEVAPSLPALRALGLPADTGPMDGEALIRAVLRAPAELLWDWGYRHLREGLGGDQRGRRRSHQRRGPCGRRRAALSGGGRWGEPRLHAGGAHPVRAPGRPHQHRRARQFGRRGPVGPRVNLKILLNPGVRLGRMSEERRNALLEELTDQVAELVLGDNRSQSLAVSLDEMHAAASTEEFRDLINGLEKAGLLNRAPKCSPASRR